MGTSGEIMRYKQTAISQIVNTPSIVEALDRRYIGKGEELIYKNIFPYVYVPDVEEEAKCYILVTVDMPKVWNDNSYLFQQVLVCFYILCHQELMKTEYGGTRIDYISDQLEGLFKQSMDFGFGEMELIANTEQAPDPNHRMRCLQFQTKTPAKSWCGLNG